MRSRAHGFALPAFAYAMSAALLGRRDGGRRRTSRLDAFWRERGGGGEGGDGSESPMFGAEFACPSVNNPALQRV